MSRGILILAAGHPYYGKMAAGLAATLKVADAAIALHLAYAGNALNYLSGQELELFASSSQVPADYYKYKNDTKYIKAKMFLYDLSPFDETIFLDADIAWLKRSPAELFEELKDVDITFANHGSDGKQSVWCDIDEVKKAYDVEDEKYYGLHSEFVYFKKTDGVRSFFKTAQTVYDDLKVSSTVFAGAIPDELPFAIACMLTNIYPHKENFRPVYWINADKKLLHPSEVSKNYYGWSMGGNTADRFAVEQYNILVKAAYHKLKMQHPYSWKQKRSFLSERLKV